MDYLFLSKTVLFRGASPEEVDAMLAEREAVRGKAL